MKKIIILVYLLVFYDVVNAQDLNNRYYEVIKFLAKPNEELLKNFDEMLGKKGIKKYLKNDSLQFSVSEKIVFGGYSYFKSKIDNYSEDIYEEVFEGVDSLNYNLQSLSTDNNSELNLFFTKRVNKYIMIEFVIEKNGKPPRRDWDGYGNPSFTMLLTILFTFDRNDKIEKTNILVIARN